MSNSSPIISLCIPTNGILEWICPVIDSIYNQNVDLNFFEVIVTDNGKNENVQKIMCKYSKKYPNFKYKKNNSFMFYNQLEALKLASGQYLKLINHRSIFEKNSLIKMIDILKENIKEKPVIYFSNGALKHNIYKLYSFDEFVKSLGIYVSWTSGVGIWKDHFDMISKDIHIDKISPHSCILFSERKKNLYMVYNFPYFREVDNDQSKKGKYDLFKAFCVEEISIVQNLYIDGDVSSKTLKSIIKDYRTFVSRLYLDFVIKRRKCSYDLSGFNANTGIYFSKLQIVIRALFLGINDLVKKIIIRK
ncbi:glycosyltransferase [Succinivibrio faecicola]|uniref:Glycosyltransferase n=1 Tax=Succinivibrio faecicola TaxID=2820300 RepID=A0ABS7DIJ1_9GAMM|nr:glycosyltransferase [Succinivibrio faecicola]MBW7571107.1 glycosyltransferase [Succinivibrio faecicola]